MRTGLFDSGTFRYVECFITVLPKGFIGLTLYERSNKNKTLASLDYRGKKCITYSKLGGCSFVKTKSTSVSVKAVIDDLREGETRTYGCDAAYADTGLNTETYTISVARVQSISDTTFRTTAGTKSGLSGAYEISIINSKTTIANNKDTTTERTDKDTSFFKETTESSSLTHGPSDGLHADEQPPLDVVSIAAGAAGTSAVTVAVVVVMLMCRRRRRSRKCTGRQVSTDIPLQQHCDQRPTVCAPELAVNCQLAEDYNEVAMNGNAACTRPLPRRPTSVESDYQDIPAPQPALEELDNLSGMTADTPTVHPEGPYAGINEDEILVEDAEESKDEKGNDIGNPTGRQADKPDGEENMTCKDPELGAATPDYVPIRDIAERKRRAKEGKAKRATVI